MNFWGKRMETNYFNLQPSSVMIFFHCTVGSSKWAEKHAIASRAWNASKYGSFSEKVFESPSRRDDGRKTISGEEETVEYSRIWLLCWEDTSAKCAGDGHFRATKGFWAEGSTVLATRKWLAYRKRNSGGELAGEMRWVKLPKAGGKTNSLPKFYIETNGRFPDASCMPTCGCCETALPLRRSLVV